MIDFKSIAPKFNHSGDSVESIIDSLLLNEDIRNFIYENDIDRDVVVNSITTLLDFKSDYNNGESIRYPGFKPVLNLTSNVISVSYKRIKTNLGSKIKAFNMPTKFNNESLENYKLNTEERKKAYQYARRFINSFKENNQIKGMYICGDFRSGKTYLSLAIANEIALKGYQTAIVYYPELSTILKGSINNETDDSFLSLVNELKYTDLLILDDFGGEAINPFVRDEALGVILNYRMNKGLPVIFTSNIPINKLADTTLRRDGSEGEMIKALRIVERIKELTEQFVITGRYVERKLEDYEN